MIGAIIGGALNAIGSLASGSDNWYYQNRAMHEQMAWQEKMNLQQQQWQESMWNKTNEYNSPLAQLQRAMEAGINPNAVFGSGVQGTTATMAQQPSTPSAPNGFSPNFDFGQIGSTIAQIDLMKAQAEKTKNEAKLVEEQTEEQSMKNSVFLTGFNVDTALKASQTHLNNQQKDNLQFQLDVLFPQEQESNEQDINLKCGAAIELNQRVANMRKEEKLYDEQIESEKKRQGVLEAQEASEYASAKASNEQAKVYGEEAKSIKYDNASKKVVADVAAKFGVDASQLDAIEQINLELYNAGYSSKEIDEFWRATRGDLTNRFKNALTKGADNALQDPLGTVKGIVGLRRGRKGSVANPRPSTNRYRTKSGKLVTVPSKQ